MSATTPDRMAPAPGVEAWAQIRALHRARPRDRVTRASLGVLALMLVLAWPLARFDFEDLRSERRLANLERFAGEIVPYPLQRAWREGSTPAATSVVVEWGAQLWREQGRPGATATLAISILAIVLAAAMGAVVGLPASRTLMRAEAFVPDGRESPLWRRGLFTGIGLACRSLLAVLRAVPEYLWAFLLLAIFGPNAWPAILALALHNTGILGRLGAETVENAPPQAATALRAAGASRAQIALVALVPALLPRLLLYFFYRWETCVREATVLGMLGIASLGLFIEEARARTQYDTMLFLVGVGVVLVLVGDLVSSLTRAWVRRVG